jgi:hypothetical protein
VILFPKPNYMKAGNPNKEIPLFQKVLSDTSDF